MRAYSDRLGELNPFLDLYVIYSLNCKYMEHLDFFIELFQNNESFSQLLNSPTQCDIRKLKTIHITHSFLCALRSFIDSKINNNRLIYPNWPFEPSSPCHPSITHSHSFNHVPFVYSANSINIFKLFEPYKYPTFDPLPSH